jgi:hypothetical protein
MTGIVCRITPSVAEGNHLPSCGAKPAGALVALLRWCDQPLLWTPVMSAAPS